MAHNFIWTSTDMEGIPNRLMCGIEVVDGYIKIFNLNPDRDEYLMSEDKLNPEFDGSTITADWITANLEVTNHNATYLKAQILNPALDLAPTEEDFSHGCNGQIQDGYHWDLLTSIHKDILDPMLFEHLRH